MTMDKITNSIGSRLQKKRKSIHYTSLRKKRKSIHYTSLRKESLNSDGEQSHQYQQNEQSPHLNSPGGRGRDPMVVGYTISTYQH